MFTPAAYHVTDAKAKATNSIAKAMNSNSQLDEFVCQRVICNSIAKTYNNSFYAC